MSLFWIIVSYILGSFPSGYIFGRLSGKKVLEIGWRKTSGSNVFKNVGKWQGVLTGLLDVSKGYLAILGAQKLGLSGEFQAISGMAAVAGHNWSLFLKFSGGRGIGTFIGAFFAISPAILGYSIIPLILLAVIWDAAIGTLLFLAAALFISFYLDQFSTVGLFALISLAPILIKRLSPIKEISRVEKPFGLFLSRIVFDDEAPHDFRIKRIFGGAKRNSQKAVRIMRPLAGPLLYPPKMGWKAAKYGVKMAKKPIEMVLGRQEKIVTEIFPEDLKKMMIAATQKIVLYQEEINKINVFPVADKDTGYNLAATLLGVESVISRKNYRTMRELAKDIKDAAMVNARGNAGMIYTGYLMEVLNKIDHLEKADAFHLALALKSGIAAARNSVAEPVNGTILDVVKAAGEKALEEVRLKKEKNIIKILEEALKVSEIALEETKEKLEVLKQNNVVDAGALGFVKILEAWVECLKGSFVKTELAKEEPSFFVTGVKEKPENKKEVAFSLRKSENADIQELKEKLLSVGESVDVIESDERIKIHIHADSSEAVKEKLQGFEILDWLEEDIVPTKKESIKKQPLGLVVGETANLPPDFIEKNQIEVVPFGVNFPNDEEAAGKTFYEKLKTAKKLPTTSAATFGDFFNRYKSALEKFEKILVIVVSSRLSGTYSQARIARSIFKKPEKLNIYVFDCFTIEVAEGLIAFRAQELVSQGKNTEEIVEILKDFCPKVRLIGCLESLKYIIHGGRLTATKLFIPLSAFLQKIRVRPMIEIKEGKIKLLGARFGKDIAKILAKEIEKENGQRPIVAAISHADNPKAAQKLKEELEKNHNARVLFVSSVSPAIGIHAGPGAVLAAFYTVDN